MSAKGLVGTAATALFGLAMVAAPGDVGGAEAAQGATPAAGGARAYCEVVGGTPVERVPVLGPGGTDATMLAGSALFCEFTGGEGAEPADSRIVIGAETLFATRPTRATLAWREQAPLPPATPEAGLGIPNPASVYCAFLGGAEGTWVDPTAATDAPERAATLCVFPDLSLIDSWGLAYHAQGVVRGADLGPLLHWLPAGATPEAA